MNDPEQSTDRDTQEIRTGLVDFSGGESKMRRVSVHEWLRMEKRQAEYRLELLVRAAVYFDEHPKLLNIVDELRNIGL